MLRRTHPVIPSTVGTRSRETQGIPARSLLRGEGKNVTAFGLSAKIVVEIARDRK